MVNEGDFPHLLVFGPNGAGKKTRVNCILRELYGNGVEKLKLERHEVSQSFQLFLEIISYSRTLYRFLQILTLLDCIEKNFTNSQKQFHKSFQAFYV